MPADQYETPDVLLTYPSTTEPQLMDGIRQDPQFADLHGHEAPPAKPGKPHLPDPRTLNDDSQPGQPTWPIDFISNASQQPLSSNRSKPIVPNQVNKAIRSGLYMTRIASAGAIEEARIAGPSAAVCPTNSINRTPSGM